MARQLYDYWFVQFDFPDSDGKPYKSSGGKMVYSEKLKREIPDGWEVVNLFDGVEVQYGFPFSTELFVEDETAIPVVRIRDILNGTTSAFSTEIADSKYKLAKGDLLIGMDGNFHMNLWSDDKAYLNQRSVRIRRKEDNQISALQVLFEIAPYIKAKEQNAKGSTVGHLSDKDLKGIWLLSPSSNAHFVPALTFGNIAANLISNRNEIEALTAKRDKLLPLLMNGQVSVRPSEVNCDLSILGVYASALQLVNQYIKSIEFLLAGYYFFSSWSAFFKAAVILCISQNFSIVWIFIQRFYHCLRQRYSEIM